MTDVADTEQVYDKQKYKVEAFSAESFYTDEARVEIENRYHDILEISATINRRSVSFQMSKNAAVHGWLKYREGFSAGLVDTLLDDFRIRDGQTVLDPFLGSGTTSLVSQIRGINSIGFDILPTSRIAITAKQNILKYDLLELAKMRKDIETVSLPTDFNLRVNSIPITEGAYPEENDRMLAYLLEWSKGNISSSPIS